MCKHILVGRDFEMFLITIISHSEKQKLKGAANLLLTHTLQHEHFPDPN